MNEYMKQDSAPTESDYVYHIGEWPVCVTNLERPQKHRLEMMIGSTCLKRTPTMATLHIRRYAFFIPGDLRL